MAQSVRPVNTANSYKNVAAAAGGSIINRPSYFCRVIILTAGSAVVTFYDNAAGDTSGNKIGALPATTVAGQVYDFEVNALLGISASVASSTPEYVVTFNPTDFQGT